MYHTIRQSRHAGSRAKLLIDLSTTGAELRGCIMLILSMMSHELIYSSQWSRKGTKLVSGHEKVPT